MAGSCPVRIHRHGLPGKARLPAVTSSNMVKFCPVPTSRTMLRLSLLPARRMQMHCTAGKVAKTSGADIVNAAPHDSDIEHRNDVEEAAVSSNEVPFGGPGAAKQSNDAFNGITEEPPEISTSDLDRQILKLWFPAILNLVLIPLVGAVDVFWVGHMNNAITLAGMGAANQVFNSAFWIISFLPTLVTPLVAKAAAKGDSEGLQRQVGEAMFLSAVIGMLGCLFMTFNADLALRAVGVMPGSDVAMHAAPYIKYRALGFVPAICATVGFATYRGMMDVTTPLKISLFTQTLNAVLDPLLIFGLPSIGLPALGVGGAAMATSIAEVASVCIYLRLMLGRKLLSLSDLFRMPKVASLRAMMAGGTAVQLRSLALNLTFICVTRATLAMDATGTSAAAHTLTIQMWQLGGIALLALSSIASALVPKRLNEAGGGQLAAKVVADRLLWWGLLSGSALGVLQMLGLPLLKVFTSLPDVQSAAMIPSIIGASLQLISGVVFCGEGIMQGHQAFGRLALNTAAASAGLLTCLHFFGSSLTGVWCSFWVFNGIRLVFALQHHWVAGPLAPARLPALKAA